MILLNPYVLSWKLKSYSEIEKMANLFRLKRLRGKGLKFYLFFSVFGVASTFYILQPVIQKLEARSDSYLNRGKPKKVLDDKGKDFLADKNLTPKDQDQLKRWEKFEKAQLSGTSPSKDPSK